MSFKTDYTYTVVNPPRHILVTSVSVSLDWEDQ